jgi:chorismate mutase/prephenate dehydratase
MSELDNILSQLRARIDATDVALVRLINERASLVKQIGEAKAAAGVRVYTPDREKAVLDRIAELNEGPMTAAALRAVYRELMSASLALERAPRIAVLGPAGSFSHLAGRRKFGLSVEFEFLSSITDVFDAVQRGRAESGLVPVENSTAGGIGETLDLLCERDAKVCGEVNVAIRHHLLGACPIDQVQHVYSKPEVFQQCHRFLDATGLLGKTVATTSTSAAAEIAKTQPGAAAIAGELAAELFGLSRIAEFIEDDPGNVTRFLILAQAAAKPTGSDKTSVVFSVGHEPGTLAAVLDVFRSAGVNMLRIESRSNRRRKWDYHFFVDLEGHGDRPPLADTLREAAKACSSLKVLGSYPRSEDTV